MSIDKIISIKDIGRFVSCAQKGPEFKKFNFLFAENGRGKTTLCAVLRSLQSGHPAYINERKTIAPTPGAPAVELRISGAAARYHANTWSQLVPEIAIFDSTFVAENVHAGEYVDREHRANLLHVIVGAHGVALASRINALDDEIRAKNAEVVSARRAVQQHIPDGVSIDAFVVLPEDNDIDRKIATATDELAAAKRAGEITSRPALTEVSLPALPAAFDTTLAETLETVAKDAEQQITRHVEEHAMGGRGLPWLEEGATFDGASSCPFCGQGIESIPIVEAYKQFFSAEYAAFLQRLKVLRPQVIDALGTESIFALEQTTARNVVAVEFWGQFDTVALPALDIAAVSHTVRTVAQEAVDAVDRKLAKPLEDLERTATLGTAIAGLGQVVEQLEVYNAAVRAANDVIARTKVTAAQADIAALERKLTRLSTTRMRHSPAVKVLCDELRRLTTEKDVLDQEKADAKRALDAHGDTMIRDYEASINRLLEGFGAGFRLANSRKTYIGGTPTSTYQILINGHPVELGSSTTPVGTPSFRTTLSSGDKSTLALAFFLARLDHDPGKTSCIVVLDDPFNSQDRSRRERTAELLRTYGIECAQLFLLSHDPHFLHLVYSKVPRAERHSVQLSRGPGNSTSIEEWDVEEETKDGYFKEHAALSSYLLNGSRDLIDIVRKIRPVLEGYLRYRFPNRFPANKWLGDMLSHIRTEGAAHPMYDSLADLAAINDYSKRYHHDTNPGHADAEPIDDGELQGYVRRALQIVGGY